MMGFIPETAPLSARLCIGGGGSGRPLAATSWHASGRAAIARALAGRQPGRFWAPALLCGSVADAARVSGFETHLYDVDESLSGGPEDLKTGDVWFWVHFFGVPRDASQAAARARAAGAWLLEDGAHALPGSSPRLGAWGEAIIYSLRKQLPVPDGGLLLRSGAAATLAAPPKDGPALSFKRGLMMCAEALAFAVGINVLPLKDALKKSAGSAPVNPDPLAPPSRATLRILPKTDVAEISRRRRKNFFRLSEALRGLPGAKMPVSLGPDGSPWCFPLLHERAEEACAALRRAGIAAWRWPGMDASLESGRFPGSSLWARTCLCLPVHEAVDDAGINGIARAVRGVL